MKIGLYYLVSETAASKLVESSNYELVKRLSEKTGYEMEFTDLDHLEDYELFFVFIGGGGTEGIFLSQFDRLPKPVILLTTGASNSLAASMEILSWLKQNEYQGEIIHGSEEYMANRIKMIGQAFKAKNALDGFRLGRVGRPSDWLISSKVNAREEREENNINIIDVDMQEFFDEIAKKYYEENKYTEMIRKANFDPDEIELALQIYGALKRICKKYKLNGVTVRCFDLLGPVKGTGCVALAILNSEGIYASCEGDVPALISMAILGELTGEPVFMANSSRIYTDTNEIVFAHCTLPVTMPESFELMTHFESQIGVAFRGKIKEGPVTIFKTDGMMMKYFASAGVLEENLSESLLCRTQVKIKLHDDVQYFLNESIGNHHLIIKGDHVALIDEFYKWL